VLVIAFHLIYMYVCGQLSDSSYDQSMLLEIRNLGSNMTDDISRQK